MQHFNKNFEFIVAGGSMRRFNINAGADIFVGGWQPGPENRNDFVDAVNSGARTCKTI